MMIRGKFFRGGEFAFGGREVEIGGCWLKLTIGDLQVKQKGNQLESQRLLPNIANMGHKINSLVHQ